MLLEVKVAALEQQDMDRVAQRQMPYLLRTLQPEQMTPTEETEAPRWYVDHFPLIYIYIYGRLEMLTSHCSYQAAAPVNFLVAGRTSPPRVGC